MGSIRLDLGDAVLSVELVIAGIRPPRIHWTVGPPRDTTSADRVAGPRPVNPPIRKEAPTVQLQADKKVALTATVSATDEVGNPVTVNPGDATVSYMVDDPSIINLTDNGDGTAEAATTGALGTAQVTASVTHNPTGRTGSDVLTLEVVPGDAQVVSVAVSAGTPEEVTPDV